MQTQMVRLANLGDWRDTWGDLKDKYNDTFNPDVETPLKPAGAATTAPAPVESKVFGIPSSWLLYGGLAAIAGAALLLVSNKKKSKR